MPHPPPLVSSTRAARSVWMAWYIDLLIVFVSFISINLAWIALWAIGRTLVITVQTGSTPIPTQLGEMGVLSQMLMTIVSIGLPTLGLFLWRHRPTSTQWQSSWQALTRSATWGWVLLIAASCLAFSTCITGLGEKLGMGANPSNVQIILQGWANHPLVLMMMVVVLAPIYEEVLFRRILFRRLWQAGCPMLGMLLSGFLFAFVHEIPGINGNSLLATLLLWFVYTNMGIAFAWIYYHTGTLYAAIAAHALNNAVALLGLIVFGVS